jgi:peptidyl-prolyl cis-trans isomerase D
VVATVEGIPITWGEYQDAYKQKIETYRKLFKDKLDETRLADLDISTQTLDSLIESKLLLAIARQEGLWVSDEEVARYIQGHPAFQVGGYFNRNRYLYRLRNLGLTPAEYEESIRELLMIEQVQEAFRDAIHPTEAELRLAYKLENEQVSTTYLYLKAEDFASRVKVTEDALEAFYRKNSRDFVVPERRKIAYLVFKPEDFEKEVSLDPDQVREYYELHEEEYLVPEQIRVRHILLKVPSGASAEEEARVRSRAEALLEKARSGEDFARLARDNSQDASASRGGDLGFFSRGKMVKAFEEVAFSLKEGQVGGPVRTPFGYHIIKLEARRPERKKPLEEVKDQIRWVLIAEEARYLALDAADAALETIRSSAKEGSEALKAAGSGPIHETEAFSQGDPLPDFGPDEDAIRRVAFGLDVGEVSDVVEGERNSYIVSLLEREPEHVPPLEAIRDRVEEAFRLREALKLARAEAQKLASELKSVEELSQAARKLKLSSSPQATGWFTRQGPVPHVGSSSDYIRKAFTLAPGAFASVPAPEGAYVFTVTGQRDVTEEGFASARKELFQRLKAQKAQSLYAAWILRLRQTRNIEVDEDFFPDYRK